MRDLTPDVHQDVRETVVRLQNYLDARSVWSPLDLA